MRRLAAFIGTLALFGQTDEVKNPRTSVADVAAGAKTFRSHCAECHGLNGEGGRGPNLANGNFYHGSSDAELLKNISEGIPGTEMPGLFYSPDRVWQVVAYVRSLNLRKPTAGNPASGVALYRAAGCAECHRIQGEGGQLGPDLTGIGRTRSAAHLRQAIVDPGADVRQRYWVVKFTKDDGKKVSGFLMNEDTYTVQLIDFEGRLHSYVKSGLKDYSMEKTSRMPSYRGRIKDDELDHLVAYLSSLDGNARPLKGDKK